MLEEILKDLEEIKKHKWAPSLSVASLVEKLSAKVESALQNLEASQVKVEEEKTAIKKKVQAVDPSIYIPNGGVDIKKSEKGQSK